MASRRPSLTAHPFRPLLSALSLLSLLTGGCSMHMPLPGKLASEAETMPVREKKSLLTDRIHWVRFGPFLAERIRKHQAPSEWDGRLGRARLQSDADYRFLLRTGAEGDWTCSCRNHAERVDFFPDLGPIREIGYRISLECGLEPSSGGPAWQLTLSGEDSSGGVLHGGLSGGTSNIAVTGTRGSWGGKGAGGTHTGFRFQGVDRDVGAVELAGRPRVLMLPGAQPGLRGALAGVSVALLLYEDLNERIREEVRNKLIYGIQVFSAVTP